MAEIDPENYLDPPSPSTPTTVIDHHLRIEVMRYRVSTGQQPCHPDDLDAAESRMGIHVTNTPNGKVDASKSMRDACDWPSDNKVLREQYLTYVMSRFSKESRMPKRNRKKVTDQAQPVQEKIVKKDEKAWEAWLARKRLALQHVRDAINELRGDDDVDRKKYRKEADKVAQSIEQLDRAARKDA